MHFYKDFIYHLRKHNLGLRCILVTEDLSPKMKEFIRLLFEIKFEDNAHHTYYGKIKHIVTSFMCFWSQAIDFILKQVDKYTNVITKEELMSLMEQTIQVHQSKQLAFSNDFLPITSDDEQKCYDEIKEKHEDMMDNLNKMKEELKKLDKKEEVEKYAKENFPSAITRETHIFDFAHTYISLFLSDKVREIKTGLEDILFRLRNNLRKLNDECDEHINNLMNQLYNKKKEQLEITRRGRRCPDDEAEVERSIEIFRQKIDNYEEPFTVKYLKEEVKFWEKKIQILNNISNTLKKLKTEEENVIEQEKVYNELRSTEFPGSRHKCWEDMGKNFKERKIYVREKFVEASKTLITFFCCRGPNRIIYTDHVGPYYVDFLGHQVYCFDYMMKMYHMTCDGKFRTIQDLDKYYFDKISRYILNDDGEKMYQIAPCSSQYQLGKDNVLMKITKDCGHSERVPKQCRMEVKDLTNVELLPETEILDIKQTMKPEVVKYLWDAFGSILPEALSDVGKLQPKNPIHYFAHRLLYHKYRKSKGERREKKKEAEMYRKEIFQKRKDEAVAASKVWKAKQVKRRKPEESDDTQEWATYNAYLAENDFINFLDIFYN